MLARVEAELLTSHIAAKITAGKRGAQGKSVLISYQEKFQQKWKAKTSCRAGYIMEDCSEYKGKHEDLAITSSAASPSSSQNPNS